MIESLRCESLGMPERSSCQTCTSDVQRNEGVSHSSCCFDGLVTVQCSTANMNEDVFCDFVERDLLPHLLPFNFNGVNVRSVVLLDNATIHHTRRPIELIQSVGAIVHFLPPYSPDLNPIEEMFAKARRHSYKKMIQQFRPLMRVELLLL